MKSTAGAMRAPARKRRLSRRSRLRARGTRCTTARASTPAQAYWNGLTSAPAVAGITLENVSKVYGDGTLAVDDLSLDIGDGEFVVLVGPSGCGKTTALRMVAGLEEITEGEVRVGDRVVNDLPPKDRDIAMVFQNYALYPHMTVED